MKTLIRITWTVFAIDVLLAIGITIAAFMENEAATKGLAMAYVLGFVAGLSLLGLIAGLSTHFRTRIGLCVSILIGLAPWITYAVHFVGRYAAGPH